jgi:hypothetical protein
VVQVEEHLVLIILEHLQEEQVIVHQQVLLKEIQEEIVLVELIQVMQQVEVEELPL